MAFVQSGCPFVIPVPLPERYARPAGRGPFRPMACRGFRSPARVVPSPGTEELPAGDSSGQRGALPHPTTVPPADGDVVHRQCDSGANEHRLL